MVTARQRLEHIHLLVIGFGTPPAPSRSSSFPGSHAGGSEAAGPGG